MNPLFPRQMSKRDASVLDSANAQPVVKRHIPDNAHPLEGMTKAELQAALRLGKQSFKELREIGRRLEKFSPIGREDQLDLTIETADLVMKKYPQAQIFVCYRCDHVKTSNMKAKFKTVESICGSCYDHLTRCVIPFRGLPEHQRPARCLHKVPKTYQKQYR